MVLDLIYYFYQLPSCHGQEKTRQCIQISWYARYFYAEKTVTYTCPKYFPMPLTPIERVTVYRQAQLITNTYKQ